MELRVLFLMYVCVLRRCGVLFLVVTYKKAVAAAGPKKECSRAPDDISTTPILPKGVPSNVSHNEGEGITMEMNFFFIIRNRIGFAN